MEKTLQSKKLKKSSPNTLPAPNATSGTPSTSDKIIAIIQARASSERLPNKIFKELEGIPVLGIIIKNLQAVKEIQEVWVATSEPGSDRVKSIAKDFGANTYIGHPDDVLSRYLAIAKSSHASILVRATGDNPFVDTARIKKTMELHRESDADVCAFLGLPLGATVETLKAETLRKSYFKINQLSNKERMSHKEHVSTYLKVFRKDYKIIHKPWPVELNFHPALRLTIDEQKDYEFAAIIARILKERKLWPDFALEDILHIVRDFPYLVKINSHIRQRKWNHNIKSAEATPGKLELFLSKESTVPL
jgi:spore coat polysaccharide biosynthesis protein SpsF